MLLKTEKQKPAPPAKPESQFFQNVWKVYFLIYLAFVIGQTITFFKPSSPISLYYHVLIAFDVLFLIQYCLNALSIILNLGSCLPFYFQICGLDVLSKPFWRLMFGLRLSADLCGRSYDLLTLRALSFQDSGAHLPMLLALVMIPLPSYVALYRYAFAKKREA